MSKIIVYKFIILLLIPICFGMKGSIVSTNQIRSQLEQAPFDESVAEDILYQLRTMQDKDALHTAFLASAEGIMCIHKEGVIKKMKHANNALAISDEAVQLDDQDYEIRFIRFTIQSQVPKILGKSTDLRQDKKFLLYNFNAHALKNVPYRSIEEMVHVMEESKEFSELEILEIKRRLYTLNK